MNNNLFFDLLAKDREESVKILEKPSMRGVQTSVVEKYSEKAHFVYELLQNADDVKATYVKFRLKKDGLVFTHNGTIGFNVSDPRIEDKDKKAGRLGHINAITSIGQSSKTDIQIGKFGVGFKSVFQYTATPEIYEDNIPFKIERFIVPVRLNNTHSLRKKGETLFSFPFDHPITSKEKAFSDIAERLKQLESPLLFIKNLEEIEWEIEGVEKGGYSKEVYFEEIQEDVFVQKIKLTQTVNDGINTNLKNLLLLSRTVPNYPKYKYFIAYNLTDKERVAHDKEYPAYCFFSTREVTHLNFIIQAPFLLIDNRQGIKRGETWNEQLIGYLAQLTADSIPICKEMGLLDDDFFNVLPINQEDFLNDLFFMPFFEKTNEKLQLEDEELFPTKEGGYTNYVNTYIADSARLLNLLSSSQLGQLLKIIDAHWILPTITSGRREKSKIWNYILKNISVMNVTPQVFISDIHSDFLNLQSDEWMSSFYLYLSESSFIWDSIKYKPIIRLNDGTHLAPFKKTGELQTFLPTKHASEFPIVKKYFVENEEVLVFLKKFGLREPDLKAEIDLKIIPYYEGLKRISSEIQLNHFEVFFNYYQKCSKNELYKYLEKIKKIPFILVINQKNEKSYGVPPPRVYFPKEDLKLYFEGFEESLYWFDEEKYNDLFIKLGEEEVISFLGDLGVFSLPRQVLFQYKSIHDNEIKHLALQNIKATEWYHINDYKIDGLENCIENITVNKSKFIWNFLLDRWRDYNFKKSGEYRYFYYSQKTECFNAYFVTLLKEKTWLFNQDLEATPILKITLEDLEANYQIDSPISQSIIRILGIQKAIQYEWQKNWNESEKKTYYEMAKKFEGVTDEDLEELRRIKERNRIISRRQNSSRNRTIKSNNIEDVGKLLRDVSKNLYELNEQVLSLQTLGVQEEKLKKISERYEQIKQKVKAATEANTDQKELFFNLMTLQDFASELTHIIRTAISSIMNRAQFLKMEFPNPEFEDVFKLYAHEIHQEMVDLRRIVDFMLSYADTETNFEYFNIKDLLEKLFNHIYKQELQKGNIHVVLNVEEDFQLYYLKKFFEDIIGNLISNSIKILKTTENKTIKCSTQIVNNEFVILFSDNGPGVEESIKDKIFDIYISTTQEQGGAGLGLYIVKTRLTALNGTIELVESEFAPHGATFKITLPFKK